MSRSKLPAALVLLTSLLFLEPLCHPGLAQGDSARLDVRKSVVESPLKKAIANKSSSQLLIPVPPNLRKIKIEGPTKKLISEEFKQPLESKEAGARANFTNPKVKPGLVSWHADFESACLAAKKSGKPILLFQMMGKLDDGFC